MKILLCLLFCVTFAGCVPIGLQGKTLALDAQGSAAAARSTGAQPSADVRAVSA